MFIRALLAAFLIAAPAAALAVPLVHYDPTGAQQNTAPVNPAMVNANVTASALTQTLSEGEWNNANRWPVGRTLSGDLNTDVYLTFTVEADAGFALDLTLLEYDKQSYSDFGATSASVRSSLDGFASDIDMIAVTPTARRELLAFDLSALPLIEGAVEFRIYFYSAVQSLADWTDLVSSANQGSGLLLSGEVTRVPETGTIALLGSGLLLLGLRRRRR